MGGGAARSVAAASQPADVPVSSAVGAPSRACRLLARSLPPPWLEFVAWCRARGLRPLPAHPWTLAAYARWCEPRQRYQTILGRVQAIARVHLLKCASSPERHPTVVRTLALIEAREQSRGLRADLFQLDETPGERPAAAEGPRGRNPGKLTKAKAKPPGDGSRRSPRSLRASPRLVSRRQP